MPRAMLFCLIAIALLTGCSTGPQSPTPGQKQDAALNNPYGYKEDVPSSISNTNDLGKDLNDLFNP